MSKEPVSRGAAQKESELRSHEFIAPKERNVWRSKRFLKAGIR